MKKTAKKRSKQNRNKAQPGVLILECLDSPDPGSEGRFLSHMFDIMEVDSQYIEIRNQAQLLSMMETSPFDTIHLTTHGTLLGSKEQFAGFWTPAGGIRLRDFPEGILAGKILISTACRSGQSHFRSAFLDRVAAKYLIAPSKSPLFRSSIFFAYIYYHNTFVLSQSSKEAVRRYTERYKNPARFSL